MSAGRANARPKRAGMQLRQIQKAIALADCIRIAAEYREDGRPDLADALAGLLVLLEATASLLDHPENVP